MNLIQSVVGAIATVIIATTSIGSIPLGIVQPASIATQQDKLDVWLNKLIQVESGGKADIKVLDSNNRYSYGVLQFQMATFKGYVKQYNLLPYAEDREIENSIYDCDLQKALAKRMIQEDYNNWKHWYNSVVGYQGRKGIGLPPKEL